MYGALKFSDLVTKPNPIINTYFKDDGMTGTFLNLNERNFRIAFTVESFLSPIKQKNDPRYVKYLVRLNGKRNGQPYQKVLQHHTCTDEEFDAFFPIKAQNSNQYQAIRENPDRGMVCLDWNDNDPYELIGYEFDDETTYIDIILVPCNYVHTLGDYRGDSVSPECIGDQEQ